MSLEEQRIKTSSDVTVEVSLYDKVSNVRVSRQFPLYQAYFCMVGFTHFFGDQASELVDELAQEVEEMVTNEKQTQQ